MYFLLQLSRITRKTFTVV